MDSLIFDRTSNSFYNVSDVNRVEEWTEALANRLLNLGYTVTVKPKKVWYMGDIVDNVQLDRIRANVNALQNGYFSIPEWREVLFGNRFNYAQADALEWDLQQCYNWLEQMVGVFVPCGSYQSGAALYLPSEVYYYVTVFIPFQTSKMVYNGLAQSPVWSSLDGIDIVNESAGSDAGEYKTVFKPKPNHKWDDGTTGEKTVSWTIEKATGSLSVNPSTVALTKENPSAEITVDYVGDGELQIVTTSPDITAVLSGNKITITAKANSEATVSVGVVNSKNYTTPDSVFCSVSATGFYVDTHTLLLLHGEDITDSSKYKVPLTNQGVVVSTAQSKFGGKSLYFNKKSSISIILETFQNIINKSYTIDFWQYKENDGISVCINRLDSPGYFTWFLGFLDKLYSAYSPGSWNAVNDGITPGLVKNKWQHHALVKNDKVITYYLDGRKSFSAVLDNVYQNGDNKIMVGNLPHNPNFALLGYIDEFRISDVARWTENFTPPTEPYDIYKKPSKDPDTLLLLHGDSVEDSSQHKVPLTNSGVVVSTEQSKFGNKSLFFGSKTYMTCNVMNSGPFTVDFWAYILPNNPQWAAPFHYHKKGQNFTSPDASNRGLLGITGYSGQGKWYFQLRDQDNTLSATFAPMKANTWIHFAAVSLGNGEFQYYANGKKVASFSNVKAKDFAPVIMGNHTIGNSGADFLGYIDEFRISRIARWTSNFTPPNKPYD